MEDGNPKQDITCNEDGTVTIKGNAAKNPSTVSAEKPRSAQEWIALTDQLPPHNEVVMTKIDDGHGVRNEQLLRLRGRLWWFVDDSMYIYYAPTHWRHAEAEAAQRTQIEIESLDAEISALQERRAALVG